jgi:hypothetical protein
MAENTEVGPGGGNVAAHPVTAHDTYGHLDDTPDGGVVTDAGVGGSDGGPAVSGSNLVHGDHAEGSLQNATGSPVNAGGMV